MKEQKVLTNIIDDLDQVEADIAYYQYHISLIDNGLAKLNLPQTNRESLVKLKAYAWRKIQEIRLAQLMMLEEHKIKQIVQSN